jgi:hypothetical protein
MVNPPTQSGEESILPLAVPDLEEVKAFANHLNSLGKHWQGRKRRRSIAY